MSELKTAVRGLGRAPMFTVIAGLALALGIGANTAVFSVVNAVLLRPLPWPDEDRVVRLYNRWEGTPEAAISPAEYFDYAEGTGSVFAEFGVWGAGSVNLTGGGQPERVQAAFITPGAMDALDAAVIRGRSFTEADDEDGGQPVALISSQLHQRRFGGENIVDRDIIVDGNSVTVIGILSADFVLPTDFRGARTDVFVPLGLERATVAARGSHFLAGIARLADGVDAERVQAVLDQLTTAMVATYPDNYPRDMRFGAWVRNIRDDIAGQVRPVLLILLGAVGLVLLVVCANVASLTLTRADARRREFAVRAALGAGRVHLVRQLLTESIALSAISGVLGVLLAAWGTAALIAIQPQGVPLAGGVSIDGRVLGFAIVTTLLAAALFGLAPLLQSDRDPARVLREGGRGATAGHPRQRLRRSIVTAELALAVVLLSGAALLVRSFITLTDVDPGYDANAVLTTRISLPSTTYSTDADRRRFFRALVEQTALQPGVLAAGAVANLPLSGPLGDLNINIEGRERREGEVSSALDWQVITPGYFDAIGMRLVSGRDITMDDDADAPGAVIINEAAARLHFPDEDPLGRRFQLGGDAGPGWVTVVGVAADIRHARFDEPPRAEMYLPHQQFTFWNGGPAAPTMSLVIRTAGEPAAFVPAVRSVIASIDGQLPTGAFQTMQQVRDVAFAGPRFYTTLMGVFGSIALLLAALGVYGLISFTVGLRGQEFGIRVALGATRSEILSLVIRQMLAPVGVGLLIGGGLAVPLTRALAGLLFEVQPGDPATIAVVVTLLGAVSLLACWLPARRATRSDPVAALRIE